MTIPQLLILSDTVSHILLLMRPYSDSRNLIFGHSFRTVQILQIYTISHISGETHDILAVG